MVGKILRWLLVDYATSTLNDLQDAILDFLKEVIISILRG